MNPMLLTPKEFNEVPVLHQLLTQAETALESSDDDLLFYELLNQIHTLDVVGRLQALSVNPFLRPLWDRVSILDSCAQAKLDADLSLFAQLSEASESTDSNQELQGILQKMTSLGIPKKLSCCNGTTDLQAQCNRMLEAVVVKVRSTQTTTTTTTTTTSSSHRFLALNHQAPTPNSLNLSDKVSSSLDSWIEQVPSLREKLGRQDVKVGILRFLEHDYSGYLTLKYLDLSTLPVDLLFKLPAFNRKLHTLIFYQNQLMTIPSEIRYLAQLETLDLSRNQLTTLPTEIGLLTKLKRLKLSGNQLTTIPPEIGLLTELETLDLSNNPIRSLPNEILQLPSSCTIDLSGCQFSTTVLERIREQVQAEGYAGPTIHFSMPEARPAERPIGTLLKELYAIAGMENLTQEALETEWAEDPDFKGNLHSWLSRISWVAEFRKGGEGKIKLAKRIISYLELAVRDKEFLDVFKANLVGSTETCGDRVTLSILNIGIEYRLATFDKKDLVGLKDLIARGVLAMEILRDAAREKVKTLKMVDEIEVYLGYPIQLRERLQLPIDVEDMLYFACSCLTAADLNAAAELVESALANEEVVYEYLISHHIWIKALKENDPDGFAAIETEVGQLMDAGAWGQVGKVRTQMLLDLSKRLLNK